MGRIVSILKDDCDEPTVALTVPEKGGDDLVSRNNAATKTLAGRLD